MYRGEVLWENEVTFSSKGEVLKHYVTIRAVRNPTLRQAAAFTLNNGTGTLISGQAIRALSEGRIVHVRIDRTYLCRKGAIVLSAVTEEAEDVLAATAS